MTDPVNQLRAVLVTILAPENVSNTDLKKVKVRNQHIWRCNNTVDKDVRLRTLKEKQNEERQRKLEEIRAQAFAAQRFKEQKEQERRQRLEDMKVKEETRRQQVEERKKAINEAERDRLESILRRNQQRENRLESKRRNERSNLVFAFGSSTPRNLDPNNVSSSFWGHRRATSTQNITSCSNNSFTRRGAERDIENGSKKRATSAGGLERSGESSLPATPAGCASGYLGRRRTDLMPTIPSRDSLGSASRKSFNHSPASSRPSSSMSHQSTTSVTSSVSVRHRPSSGPRKPRPVSIAVTGVSACQDKKIDSTKPPLPKRKSITKSTEKISKSKPSTGENTPKLQSSPTATEMSSVLERKLNNDVGDTHKKPPDTPQLIETQQPEESLISPKVDTEDLLNLGIVQNGLGAQKIDNHIESSISVTSTENKSCIDVPKHKDHSSNESENLSQVLNTKVTDTTMQSENMIVNVEITSTLENNQSANLQDSEITNSQISKDMTESQINNDMTASQIKAKISTEEEAKAAIAERRRLAKEEAARRAEQERLKAEAEHQAELERQRQEEEQVRLLIEAQRAAEEQRLFEAILEVKKKEEEEQERRQEEARLKAAKEEADKKAKLEAEKQKAEQQERLVKEEKEREARRKRVEAIMLRTRGKNNTNNQQGSEESSEDASLNKVNGTKPIDEQNGPNDKNERLDNITQEDDPVKNANPHSIETNSSTDSINSNNLWQSPPQQFGNFLMNNNS